MNNLLMTLRQLRIGARRLEDYQKFKKLAGWYIRQSSSQFRALAARDPKIVNLGCGGKIVPEFFNVDLEWVPGIDACWDIARPLPVPDHSVDGIFSEHCLEHFSWNDAGRILKDCRRLLKPGGVIRIVVPDAELYARHYIDWLNGNDVLLPYATAHSRETRFTPLMALNRVFRDHGHLFAYDFELLGRLLDEAGFVNVRKVGYLEGSTKLRLADSDERAPESLYVEASTPA